MMIDKPMLFFCMELDDTPKLNIGRLFLIDRQIPIISNWWQATSGLGDMQGIGEFNKQRGGSIPPNYKLERNVPYQMKTKPRWQDLNGIKGNTFDLLPLAITTKEGVKRSELLVHKSRYATPISGSLGCIVLPEKEFSDFEKTIEMKCGHLDYIPLLVGYTF